MNLSRVVKLEAVVATNGNVTSVEVKGGHPVLAQAAAVAVNRWKWERASRETKEPVEITFPPQF
jgi:outer membrane biosynthesis protein TonB